MSQRKRQHDAQRWLTTAREDLAAAKSLNEAGHYSHCCFLAQQAAEKALKALWIAVDADPWGHSIQKLVSQFPRQELLGDAAVMIRQASQLDRLYIPTRYPNGIPDLTPAQTYLQEDAEQALTTATALIGTSIEAMEKAHTDS